MTLLPWLDHPGQDPSVHWLLRHHGLVAANPEELVTCRSAIATGGWAKAYLDLFDPVSGQWGGGWYGPKWIGTHYTLLCLKDLGLDPRHPVYRQGVIGLLDHVWTRPMDAWSSQRKHPRGARGPDLCVTAMVLAMASHGGIAPQDLIPLVDYVLDRHFPDGGFNCDWDRGAERSSVHTTLTVLESFLDWSVLGHPHRQEEIQAACTASIDFLLRKRLCRSERTGDVIDPNYFYLSWPPRWFYDVLRALVHLAARDVAPDPRMDEGLDLLEKKQTRTGPWPNQHFHAGRSHFPMERPGGPSPMNTIRVLRVLRRYRPDRYLAVLARDHPDLLPPEPSGG